MFHSASKLGTCSALLASALMAFATTQASAVTTTQAVNQLNAKLAGPGVATANAAQLENALGKILTTSTARADASVYLTAILGKEKSSVANAYSATLVTYIISHLNEPTTSAVATLAKAATTGTPSGDHAIFAQTVCKSFPGYASTIASAVATIDTSNAPEIAAAVIIANSTTKNAAPSIAGAVAAVVSLDSAPDLAVAIGNTFLKNAAVASKASLIFTSIQTAVNNKSHTADQKSQANAEIGATLAVLLPATITGAPGPQVISILTNVVGTSSKPSVSAGIFAQTFQDFGASANYITALQDKLDLFYNNSDSVRIAVHLKIDSVINGTSQISIGPVIKDVTAYKDR